MRTAITPAISPFAPETEPDSNAICVPDENLAFVPASDISEAFRNLSSFLPVIVLAPKSVARNEATAKKLAPTKSLTDLTDIRTVSLPLGAAKAWLTNSNAPDTFEFGGVRGCFSAMEIHRNGRRVTLRYNEFKTLAYFIKNPGRVISRDEFLDKVWGYENYPSTRTVDNHVLRLRQKLETDPAHPKHFTTVHGAGYKFVP